MSINTPRAIYLKILTLADTKQVAISAIVRQILEEYFAMSE
jgi:hypothetical protein